MPTKECTLPDGGKGWQWGDHGICYRDRADAEKQAAAAHANGYVGDSLAMDRGSVRTYDADGRLHVEISNISMEQVADYLGAEIPDWDKLGLDPEKTYQLYRPGDELKKAADTFNNIPLLSEHVPVSAWDHRPDLVIGATGSDAVYQAPYLKNSLVVWVADAIKDIENGEQKELSCAYRYTPVLEDGAFKGASYQIRMTEIIANHLAVVPVGRAGPTVVVGDSKPMEISDMSKKSPLSRKAALAKGALLAHLRPKFAADALPQLNPIMKAITAVDWAGYKSGLITALKPKMANDADVADLTKLLDSLDNETDEDLAKDDEIDKDNIGLDADPIAEILELIRGKVSDEDLKSVEEKLGALKLAKDDDDMADDGEDLIEKLKKLIETAKPAGASDEPKPTPGTAAAPAVSAKADEPEKVTKAAMDAAIAKARKDAEADAVKRVQGISEAKEVVKGYVGENHIAADSAEGVFKAALEMMDVEVSGIHPSAYRAVLEAQPKPGSQVAPRIAADAAAAKGVSEKFPGISAITQLG